MAGDLILVTGGSGFVGSHCILAALRDGYSVRTTIRSLDRANEVRQMLRNGGATEENVQAVQFRKADLSRDDGWYEACEGCVYVLHVASPFPVKAPKTADELIIPAKEGTLRALKAAKAAGTVKRVVITSSFAAIGYGHDSRKEPFTEQDWTVLTNPAIPVPPYPQSKTIAEKAAWEWISKEGGDLELAVVNPVGIFGPILSSKYAASIEIVSRLMNGNMPGIPQLGLGLVDVRDVADLHLNAMSSSQAAGQRFLAVSDEGFMWMKDMAVHLKHELGEKASKVPTRTAPNFVIRLVGWFDRSVALIVPQLGERSDASNAKAKELLDWHPRSAEAALIASAESLIEHGLVK